MAVVVFWLSAVVLGYVYVGYPFAVRMLAAVLGERVRRSAELRPTVTIVVVAYNEARNILAKIANIRALDYPPELVDILIASDASDDGMDEIVTSSGLEGVELLRVEGRLGKTACQNVAASRARGEIIAFTDATTQIARGALRSMIADFADEEVGCVAGLLVYRGKGENLTAAGGVAYWGYEVALRTAESQLGTLIGVSGCLYAVRRAAYRPIAPNLISDFVISMRMREQRLRTVLEKRALCFEETLDCSKQELSMRVRVAIRSIAALVQERRFLNILRDPLFAWQLVSHKLLRYASAYFLVTMMASSAMLIHVPAYRVALILELLVVAAGVAGFVLQLRAHKLGLLGKPYYFLLTNIASIIATMRYVMGKRVVTWNPIR